MSDLRCIGCNVQLPDDPDLAKLHTDACVEPDDYVTLPTVDTVHPVTSHFADTTAPVTVDATAFDGIIAAEIVKGQAASIIGDTEAVWSDYGKYLIDAVFKRRPQPILLIGDTGWGKTFFAKYIARMSGQGFLSVNCSEQMIMDTLVGIAAPANSPNGVFLEWADGVLTQSIREGLVFMMEEFTRADDGIRSQSYSSLDQTGRTWSIPQASGITDPNVPVHNDFWFIATANPPGGPYTTYAIDPAMDRRMVAQFRVNQPLADEKQLLLNDIKTDTVLLKATYESQARPMSREDLVDRLMKFVYEVRPAPDFTTDEFLLPYETPLARCLHTADLRNILNDLLLGFSPMETASTIIARKYGDTESKGIKQALVQHFTEGSW